MVFSSHLIQSCRMVNFPGYSCITSQYRAARDQKRQLALQDRYVFVQRQSPELPGVQYILKKQATYLGAYLLAKESNRVPNFENLGHFVSSLAGSCVKLTCSQKGIPLHWRVGEHLILNKWSLLPWSFVEMLYRVNTNKMYTLKEFSPTEGERLSQSKQIHYIDSYCSHTACIQLLKSPSSHCIHLFLWD